MKSLAAAFAFLTVLPLPQSWRGGTKEIENSVPFFPLVGVVIGLVVSALSLGIIRVLPPLPGAVVIVMVLAGASGALHLDGLADTADGFFSARPREESLDIMRDSCSGAMGVIALAFILLFKVSCLNSLAPQTWWRVCLLVPLTGRVALVLSLATLSYARAEGLGSAFYEQGHGFALIVSLIMLTAVGWLTMGTDGLIAAVLSLVIVLIFGLWCKRRIDGATGDTLGAACEIAETACLVGLCIG